MGHRPAGANPRRPYPHNDHFWRTGARRDAALVGSVSRRLRRSPPPKKIRLCVGWSCVPPRALGANAMNELGRLRSAGVPARRNGRLEYGVVVSHGIPPGLCRRAAGEAMSQCCVCQSRTHPPNEVSGAAPLVAGTVMDKRFFYVPHLFDIKKWRRWL